MRRGPEGGRGAAGSPWGEAGWPVPPTGGLVACGEAGTLTSSSSLSFLFPS